MVIGEGPAKNAPIPVHHMNFVELVNTLEQEKAQGKSGQLAYRLMYVDMVILDEMG